MLCNESVRSGSADMLYWGNGGSRHGNARATYDNLQVTRLHCRILMTITRLSKLGTDV